MLKFFRCLRFSEFDSIALEGSFSCFLCLFVVCTGMRGLEVNNSNVHKRIIIDLFTDTAAILN